MVLIRTCWYLCALFLLMLGCSSLISVVPGGEKSMVALMGTLLGLAIGSGVSALVLKQRFRKKPDAYMFRSKVVSGIGVGLAAILTLIFLFGVVG